MAASGSPEHSRLARCKFLKPLRKSGEPYFTLFQPAHPAENGFMSWRPALLIVCCLLCFIPAVPSRVGKSTSRAGDNSYSSALAAANRFLHAWQNEDHETGMMMLADSARQHTTRAHLKQFFSSGSQGAFEIQHGRRLSPGEYVFPVVLFDISQPASRPYASKLIITKAGDDDWAIERLP